MQRFVHHVDHVGVRVARAIGGHPLFHLRTLVGRRQIAGDPGWLLLAPHEYVVLERITILLGKIIRRIQLAPVHNIAGAFHRTPFAGVLRRHLVPVGAEIRRHAAGDDVSQKLRAVGQLCYSRQRKQ
jgi:hypothetical protein